MGEERERRKRGCGEMMWIRVRVLDLEVRAFIVGWHLWGVLENRAA